MTSSCVFLVSERVKNKPKKLKISSTALKELERLESISENENLPLWKQERENVLKVTMLNCAGLKPHVHDIMADYYLMHSDILFLVETSLLGNEEVHIDAYEPNIHNISRGRGIAAFSRTNGFSFIQVSNNHSQKDCCSTFKSLTATAKKGKQAITT